MQSFGNFLHFTQFFGLILITQIPNNSRFKSVLKNQGQNKYSLVLFIALLFISLEGNAANWTNSDKKFDPDKLEQLPVPESFPKYSFRAYESCESSKGSKWSNDIEIFLNEDFLWASKHDYNGEWIRIYVGRRSASGKFIINVSEASKKWKNQHKWMQYVVPNSQPLVNALKSGTIIGKVNQGSSYWRKCSLKIASVSESNKISIAKFKPIKRQIASLSSVNSRQEIALEKMAKLGFSVGKMYDFSTLINELEAEATLEKAEEEERKRAEAEAARKKAEEEERERAEAEAARKKAEEEERKRAEAEAARKKAEEEERERAEAEAARKKAEEEERKRAEAEAARKKAEEEERKRAEAEAARKKAEEEERKRAEAEAARKKAEEEERERAEAEAARKKAEEEERKRAEAEAARKKLKKKNVNVLKLKPRKKAEEEERKRAEAEAARKKAEEEERKRAEAEALKSKIQATKEEAKNLYSIFVEYVKTNSATDVLRLNELYVRAPEINLSWDKKNLDDFNKFKSEVLDIEDFKDFYEERIEELNEQVADAQLAAIELLEKLSSELKEIIAENFGTKIAKETARLTVKIEKVITDFKANGEFDAALIGQLIEDAKVLFVEAGRDLKSLEGFSLKGLTSNVGAFISDIIPNPLNLFK